MAQEVSGQSEAVAGNPDDGLRLRSVPVRAVLEAAGLSHLDLRLPHRPGRQGLLRTGLWPAPEAAERGTGPHLQPDQQSGSPDPRRPAGDLGRGGGQSDLRLRHGRRLDLPLGSCATRVGDRPFRPGLWRHGFPPEEDFAAVRCGADRIPGGGRTRRDRAGGRPRPRAWPGCGALCRDAGQSDERRRRPSTRPPPGRRASPPTDAGPW